jgi:4-amino-4-deoxy-L-arabinose transferase-like glycosyltransferase
MSIGLPRRVTREVYAGALSLLTPPERVGLIALVIACALLYFTHCITVIQSNDSAGYLYGGIRIAETGLPSYDNPLNESAGPYFTLHSFKVRLDETDPDFYLNYSPGFPLVVALFRLLIPHSRAIFLASPTMALAGVIGMYALGEALFGPRVGLVAAILLALDPVYFQMAVLSRSDAPATATMLWGLALFVRAYDHKRNLEGLLSGIILGFACLMRYVMAVALLPLALYAIFTNRRRLWAEGPIRRFMLGFGALALLILIFNQVYYGGALTTGYQAPHTLITFPFFDPSYFLGQSPIEPGGYAATLRSLWGNFRYLLILAPLSLLVVSRRQAAFLLSLATLFPILFSFYLYAPEDFGSRFLLPSFPALYLMVGQLASRVAGLATRRRSLASLLLFALVVLHSLSMLPDTLHTVSARNQREISRVALVQEFTSQTEQDSVFLARRYHDQIILYGHRSAMHFDMIPSWEAKVEGRAEAELELGLVQVINTLLEADVPVYWIPDTDPNRPDQLQLDPILQAHYRLLTWREQNPVIYSIQQK